MAESNTLVGMLSEEDFFAHVGVTPEMTEDEFLEHFGKKGMKWGQRSAAGPQMTADGRPKKSRAELKALDAQTKVKNVAERKGLNATRNSSIDAARGRIASGANKADLKSAKVQYKSDKYVIGKKAAVKALNAVKEKNLTDASLAQQAKSGSETVKAVIGTVAAGVILTSASAVG